MLIKEVNRQPVTDMDAFQRLMKESADDDSVLLLVKIGQHTQFIVLNRKN